MGDERARLPVSRDQPHTPLDGLPYFEEASYVFCGRDPRDVFLSMSDHMDNMSPESIEEALLKEGLPPDLEFPTDRNQVFALWITTGAHEWMRDGFPWGSVFDLTKTYWDFRHLPNLFFWHYADLTADRDTEARRLSAFLDIPIDESRWPALVKAASYEAMKEKADELAPGSHHVEWKKNEDFFRMARMGQWREVLTPENQALYERIAATIAEPVRTLKLETLKTTAAAPHKNTTMKASWTIAGARAVLSSANQGLKSSAMAAVPADHASSNCSMRKRYSTGSRHRLITFLPVREQTDAVFPYLKFATAPGQTHDAYPDRHYSATGNPIRYT